MTKHKTGTREQWLAARLELLKAEEELARRSDEPARRSRSSRRTSAGWVGASPGHRRSGATSTTTSRRATRRSNSGPELRCTTSALRDLARRRRKARRVLLSRWLPRSEPTSQRIRERRRA